VTFPQAVELPFLKARRGKHVTQTIPDQLRLGAATGHGRTTKSLGFLV
jgi:hypothetical protein